MLCAVFWRAHNSHGATQVRKQAQELKVKTEAADDDAAEREMQLQVRATLLTALNPDGV